MIAYTLTPTTLITYPHAYGETDVVFSVLWTYSAVDGDYNTFIVGQTDITYTKGTPFTPYADLKEEQVVDWVLDAWGPEQMLAYQAQLDQQIENQRNPPTQVLPLPWAE